MSMNNPINDELCNRNFEYYEILEEVKKLRKKVKKMQKKMKKLKKQVKRLEGTDSSRSKKYDGQYQNRSIASDVLDTCMASAPEIINLVNNVYTSRRSGRRSRTLQLPEKK